jgi:thiosulfate reductase cytochrome b subunit
VHLVALALLALFTVGHVAMVLLHPRSLADMITGGKPHG